MRYPQVSTVFVTFQNKSQTCYYEGLRSCRGGVSGIGCYCFCLVLLVLVYSRVPLGLLAYVACFVLFCFFLCYGRLSVSRCFSTSGDVSF